MQRKLLYIINPISGTKGKKNLTRLIQQKTAEQGLFFKVIKSERSGNYNFLTSVIADEKITDVIVAGGDGTVNGVIGSLYHTPVRFGIIPCGSGNGLAFSAGISKTPTLALQTIFKGKAMATDAYFVNNQFACMLCGLGFDAQVAHDFANHHTRGIGGYINKIVNNLFKASVYRFSLTINNNVIDVDAYFISVANSNQYGNNFTIAPAASLTDGWLDVVIATAQSKLSFLLQTIKQVSGLNKVQQIDVLDYNTHVLYFRTKTLKISNLNHAPLHIDGEPVPTSQQIEIAIQEDAFQLIYP